MIAEDPSVVTTNTGGSQRVKAPYSIRSLLADVPLSRCADGGPAYITVVEAWNGNLYIGSSAGEILHLVQIEPGPDGGLESPEYILATRLEPYFASLGSSGNGAPGVQQILLLPTADKACVICNSTLTFYTLPELSPALSKTKVKDCNWIGGLDLDDPLSETGGARGVAVILSLRRVLRIVKIKDQAQVLKTIEYPASMLVQRRSSIACVATQDGYALLDLDLSRKIPLPFSISSSPGPQIEQDLSIHVQQISSSSISMNRRASVMTTAGISPGDSGVAHTRSTSLGNFMSGLSRRDQSPGIQDPPADSLEAHESPVRGVSPSSHVAKPLPHTPVLESGKFHSPVPITGSTLWPMVISPQPDEFLVTTGTGVDEPGVGIFINTEGDVIRGTLEFRRYPRMLVYDQGADSDIMYPTGLQRPAYVLAALDGASDGSQGPILECHSLPGAGGEDLLQPFVLSMPRARCSGPVNLHRCFQSFTSINKDLYTAVEKTPWVFPREQIGKETADPNAIHRQREERMIAGQIASVRTNLLAWQGSDIWQIVPQDTIVRVINKVLMMQDDLDTLMDAAKSLETEEQRSDIAFFMLDFLRQKCGLGLLRLVLRQSSANELTIPLRILSETELDPRCFLHLLPSVRQDIVWGDSVLWLYQGIQSEFRLLADSLRQGDPTERALVEERMVAQFLRPYLQSWRKKRDLGHIPDRDNLFKSVHLASLRILLRLDQTQSVPARSSSLAKAFEMHGPQPPSRHIRSELYTLVDSGISCFEEAVALLEENKRLYVLSRLYQSRKQSGDVLQTWRRLIEGELDAAGEEEFEPEQGLERICEYLQRIRDPSLFREYGAWVAAKNPALGVQVFANSKSRIQFSHQEVISLLQSRAPGAVNHYLEYLVFEKDDSRYAGELLGFYLSSVIETLLLDPAAKSRLLLTYTAYRDLRNPRPTYTQFITENAPEDEWWQHRLRLLQILGGGLALQAESADIISRLDPRTVAEIERQIQKYDDLLIPEAIIMDGLRGLHDKALHHLVHGLGDLDTAIQYCLQGGSAIFHPHVGTIGIPVSPKESSRVDTRAQRPEQLFASLLATVLELPEADSRRAQTVYILIQHPRYFSPLLTLERLPEDWLVEELSLYLTTALRLLVSEQAECSIVKGLSGIQSLRINGELLDEIAEMGPQYELPRDSGVSFS